METKTQAFTVFREDEQITFLVRYAKSVGEFMEKVGLFYADGWCGSPKLVSWAPGCHDVHVDRVCAESLAAGRTIELIDGKYVARGVVEPKPAQTLGDLLRKAGDGLPSKTPTLDKLEAEHAGNAAMIARDGPARIAKQIAQAVDAQILAEWPVSTAKPALSFLTLSPDLQPSSHLVAPAHGSALLRG